MLLTLVIMQCLMIVGMAILMVKIDGVHRLANSRLTELVSHVIATGKAEALLAALQSRVEGKQEGKAEALKEMKGK